MGFFPSAFRSNQFYFPSVRMMLSVGFADVIYSVENLLLLVFWKVFFFIRNRSWILTNGFSTSLGMNSFGELGQELQFGKSQGLAGNLLLLF